jgi:hypothetical protein
MGNKAGQWQTLKLTRSILKLRRKWNVVNTSAGIFLFPTSLPTMMLRLPSGQSEQILDFLFVIYRPNFFPFVCHLFTQFLFFVCHLSAQLSFLSMPLIGPFFSLFLQCWWYVYASRNAIMNNYWLVNLQFNCNLDRFVEKHSQCIVQYSPKCLKMSEIEPTFRGKQNNK